MKYTFCLCLLMLWSCKNQESNIQFSEVTQEKSINVDLEVYDFDGLQKYLVANDDKVHVINFWATWCAPCIKELPYFEKINAEFDNVEVVLVSLDFPSKYESRLKPYIIENKLRSKVVALNDVDANSWIPKVDKNWTGAIPATIIFNQNDRKFYEQSFDYNALEKEIKQFLKF